MSLSLRPSAARERQLAERAGAMRRAPTASEALLFETLRGERLGVAFKRQVPVLGRYIVDLLAPEIRLVVEVDGPYHEERARADARRDRALERAGYRVLRLEAAVIMADLEVAVRRVREEIAQLQSRGSAAKALLTAERSRCGPAPPREQLRRTAPRARRARARRRARRRATP
jgi:very-short-patch-repair endonuclease